MERGGSKSGRDWVGKKVEEGGEEDEDRIG